MRVIVKLEDRLVKDGTGVRDLIRRLSSAGMVVPAHQPLSTAGLLSGECPENQLPKLAGVSGVDWVKPEGRQSSGR